MSGFLLVRQLVKGFPTQFAGRVGSIVRAERPAIALDRDAVPDSVAAPTGFQDGFESLKGHIRRTAASVGRIEFVNFNGEHQVLATCFRVGNDTRRVATARHVAAALLQESARLEPGVNPIPKPARKKELRKLRVVFEESKQSEPGQTGTASTSLAAEQHEIASIELSHGLMDLLLLKLSTPSNRPALPLAAADQPNADESRRIFIIGYPVSEPDAGNERDNFEALFSVNGQLVTGIKRASPGFVQAVPQPPTSTHLQVLHDATTLPGSSGSPVISANDGGLVGLHFGGRDGTDSNRMIYLPSAFEDAALKQRFDPAASQMQQLQFQAWPENTEATVHGRPLGQGQTAEDFEEIAFGPDGTTTSAAPDQFSYSPTVLSDRRDIRDRYYVPPLRDAKSSISPSIEHPTPRIHHQSARADCTGCALAAAIEHSLAKQNRSANVCPRMLYEMARLHDEYIDDSESGSSLRGAIKGFYHNGVCQESEAERPGSRWRLTVARAKQAREISLGAYYRLRPRLADFQMAVQEAGAVIVSAWTHSGWKRPKHGRIAHRRDQMNAHAFIIVGYDSDGFIIQNSWGERWSSFDGSKGLAHWAYADWAENVIDAWVLQTAPRTQKAHNLPLRSYSVDASPVPTGLPAELAALPEPRRMALIGHIAHAERAGLVDVGRIGVSQLTLRETALYLREPQLWNEGKYRGLLFIFHDPILGTEAAARICAHLVPRFKAAGLYPINVIYGADEIRSLVARMHDESQFCTRIANESDQDLTGYLERRARKIAKPMLDAFMNGVDQASLPGGSLWQTVAAFSHESIEPPVRRKKYALREVHVMAAGLGAMAAQSLFNPENIKLLDPKGALLLKSASLLGAVSRPSLQSGTEEASGWGLYAGRRVVSAPLELQLGSAKPRGESLAGYNGDWCDLLAAMLPAGGHHPRSHERGASDAVSLAGLLTDPSVLNRVMKAVKGQGRLGQWERF